MKPGFTLAAAIAVALVAGCAGTGKSVVRGTAQSAPSANRGADAPGRTVDALAAGRFAEAASAYAAALSLNPQDRKAQLGYALAQLGLGRTEQATARLRALAADDAGATADVGLALALAGQAAEGVALLEQAVRQPGATARTRQNLALALALADAWPQARALVERESDERQATWRLTQWAAWAALPPPHRLAGFLGVAPGQTDVALAQGEAPQAPEPPLLLAANEQTQTEPEAGQAAGPVVAAAEIAPAAPVQGARPATAVAQASVAPTNVAPGPADKWVIQLAAFRYTTDLEASWQRLARRHPGLLSGYAPRVLEGKTWNRLTIGAFADRQDAVSQCRALRRGGVDCFARPAAVESASHPLSTERG